MTREYTNELLELLESGAIAWETVASECLSYMSEDDVKDMCLTAEFVNLEEEEEGEDHKSEFHEFMESMPIPNMGNGSLAG